MISCHILIETVEETGPELEVSTDATPMEEQIVDEFLTNWSGSWGPNDPSSVPGWSNVEQGGATGRNVNLNSINPKDLLQIDIVNF